MFLPLQYWSPPYSRGTRVEGRVHLVSEQIIRHYRVIIICTTRHLCSASRVNTSMGIRWGTGSNHHLIVAFSVVFPRTVASGRWWCYLQQVIALGHANRRWRAVPSSVLFSLFSFPCVNDVSSGTRSATERDELCQCEEVPLYISVYAVRRTCLKCSVGALVAATFYLPLEMSSVRAKKQSKKELNHP